MTQGYSRPIMAANLRELCKQTKCDHTTADLHRRNIMIVRKWAIESFKRFGAGEMPSYLK